MCYDAAYLTKRALDYARLRQHDAATIADLEKQWDQIKENLGPKFHVSGFEHPQLAGFGQQEPLQVKTFAWGLVPPWIENANDAQQIAQKTLNARLETIFEKPAYRESAQKQRAVIVLDGFYEYHHAKGKTYPYFIQQSNQKPMAIAALASHWQNKETGQVLQSTSLVTMQGKGLMAKIHNNPKMKGPRMPLLLNPAGLALWLNPQSTKQELLNLAEAKESAKLKAHIVRRLRRKNALGNQPEVTEEVSYKELKESNQISLF